MNANQSLKKFVMYKVNERCPSGMQLSHPESKHAVTSIINMLRRDKEFHTCLMTALGVQKVQSSTQIKSKPLPEYTLGN